MGDYHDDFSDWDINDQPSPEEYDGKMDYDRWEEEQVFLDSQHDDA